MKGKYCGPIKCCNCQPEHIGQVASAQQPARNCCSRFDIILKEKRFGLNILLKELSSVIGMSQVRRLRGGAFAGIRASEAKAINVSLTTLGICINSRADRTSKHTPFRDSKLTRLLQVGVIPYTCGE